MNSNLMPTAVILQKTIAARGVQQHNPAAENIAPATDTSAEACKRDGELITRPGKVDISRQKLD